MVTPDDALARTRRALSRGLLATLVLLLLTLPAAAALPEGPRVLVDTTYAPPAGAVHTLQAGDDLQAALDAAAPGDTIVLPAGVAFTGNFVLPNKPGSGWIYIRSSALASLPPPNGRVSPAYAAAMPKIVSPNTEPVIQAELGAHHYRFVGVEITTLFDARDRAHQNLILFGFDVDGNQATTEAQLPHHITFDRCYLHGTPTGNVVRGLAANGAAIAVIDSYLSDFHSDGSDSQAIAAWNGAGPFKIVNNYLEAAGENVLFGGAPPAIMGLVPSDIEMRHNYVLKPLTWNPADVHYAGIPWVVKNLFELKNAQRVLADGNVFQNIWPAAQTGFAIQLTVRNDEGTAPWSVVQDVAFTHNMVLDAAGGVNILGLDDNAPSQRARRLLIRDSLFDRIADPSGEPVARLFQLLNGAAEVTIDHNTAFQNGPLLNADQEPTTGLVFTNNIAPGAESVVGTGTGPGFETLDTFFPGHVFARNVLAGADGSTLPSGNFFPATLNDVGFVNLADGDYRLAAASPYKNAGVDGLDIGADFGALAAATADVIEGNASSVTPPPPPPPPPPFSITAPKEGASVHGVVDVRAGAPHPSIKRVRFTVDGIQLGLQDWPPYVARWDTRFLPNGPHTLTAVALGDGDVVVATDSNTVMVANPDPTVRIATPKAGALVKGAIDVRAAVTQAASIAGLQFQLDGQNYGPLLTKPDRAVRWDTFLLPNQPHTWTAIITTLAGATIVSDPVTVTIANPTPTVRIARPAPGASVKGTITVAAAVTHRQRVTSLQFKLNGQDYGPVLARPDHSVRWDTTLLPNVAYTWTAVITTVLGETIVSDPVTVMVANPVPTVRITRPKAGTVKGAIDIQAAVTHRDRITQLQFQIDDQDFGPAITTAGYAVDWDTLATPDGPHTVRAIITTVLGDTIVSDPVSVVVSNPLPTIKIDSPKTGDTVKGKITIKATVTERQRVASVQFKLDGQNLGAPITQGNAFQVTWDADAAPAGSHTLTAVITTTTGQQITATAVTVAVAKKK